MGLPAMSIMDRLIDQETGEIDRLACVEAADLRAQREWGGDNPPPAYIREAASFVNDRAKGLRTAWRRSRGLSDDSPVTLTELPSWGASGDSYRRH
jgi:hypothetical protein